MEVKNVTLGIWNQDYGQVSNELIERLCASPNFVRVEFAHSRAELRQMVDDQRVMLAITFPPDFSRNCVGQRVAPLQMTADGRKSNSAQIDEGYVVFHVPFHGSMLFLYLSLTVFITAIIGIGLSISSIAVTQQQAMLGMMAVILTATMLSGYAAPIDNMPDWLQPFTYANPLRYIMIVIKGVFLKDMPPREILNNTWPMAIIGAFTLSLHCHLRSAINGNRSS